MALTDRPDAGDALTSAALLITAGLLIWSIVDGQGWFGVAFGSLYLLFWAAILAWLACVILAIRRYRRWWILSTAPLVLYPVFASALLVGACLAGNCI